MRYRNYFKMYLLHDDLKTNIAHITLQNVILELYFVIFFGAFRLNALKINDDILRFKECNYVMAKTSK